MRHPLTFATVTLGAAILAAHVQAATVLPLSVGAVTFSNFQDNTGHTIDCDSTFSALGSASCTGIAGYTGGDLGDGLHITGSKVATGATTAGAHGANPTAIATLTAAGGDASSGLGVVSVTTGLLYYVTVAPLGSLATSGLAIPLVFTDAGFIHGDASATTQVGGDARTSVRAFTGSLVIDGHLSFLNDEVDHSVSGGVLDQAYGKTHSIVFDFDEGETIAEVTLSASCNTGSLVAGFGTTHCFASADPFFGFDQGAFDLMMGDKTFKLSDVFTIELSAGLEPAAGGVPEPAAWALMIAGLGMVGASLRRRRRLAPALS